MPAGKIDIRRAGVIQLDKFDEFRVHVGIGMQFVDDDGRVGRHRNR